MPDYCCAVGCNNTRGKGEKKLSFYRIPSDTSEETKSRRQKWVNAIKREYWSEKEIDCSRICSEHFITGAKSNDPKHPDYVPSLFNYNTHNNRPEAESSCDRKRKQSIDRYNRATKFLNARPTETDVNNEAVDIEDTTENEKEVQTENYLEMLEEQNKSLKMKNTKLLSQLNSAILKSNTHTKYSTQNKSKFNYVNIKDDSTKLLFYTGLNKDLFDWYFSLLQNQVLKQTDKISLKDHLLIVLMKIRLGLLNKDLAYRFNIQIKMISLIYRTWVPIIASCVKFLIVWPERNVIRRNLPESFKQKFLSCVVIIDCTELFIDRPYGLTARAQTWSNYKNTNTIKYLIGITPAGSISFLSCGWGGRVSDKEITLKSGLLKKLHHGDSVMADRGFTIQTELATRGVTLNIPKFTKGKKQMPAKDVGFSRQIAHVRIHVERVIGRMRTFKILQSVIPITQVDLLDDVMVIIASLVNINSSVVAS